MKLELITFKYCPFGQRSLIVLNEKGAEFTTTFVDLKDPPDWFGEISPLGKVPVLRADGHIFFDSTVISEFLEEALPPPLHPGNPFDRARARSWIAFAEELLHTQVATYSADSKETFGEKLEALRRLTSLLAGSIRPAPFFGGERFALADAAYAPFFLRVRLMHERFPVLGALPEVLTGWSDVLLERPSVIRSIPAGFDRGYRAFLQGKGSWLLANG